MCNGLLMQLITVHAGHIIIGNQYVRFEIFLSHVREREFRVFEGERLMADLGEQKSEQFADVWVVIHDEYVHASTPPAQLQYQKWRLYNRSRGKQSSQAQVLPALQVTQDLGNSDEGAEHQKGPLWMESQLLLQGRCGIHAF